MKQQLVIIPGWGGTKQSWQEFINLAQSEFDVFFISLPGFGELPPPSTVWGVADFVEYVKQETIKLKLDRPILLGHSFGGQLAVNLSANNPQLFSRLILSGAAVLRPKYLLRRMILTAIAKTGKIIFNLPLLNRAEKLMRKLFYRAIDSPDYDKTAGMKREIYKKIIRESQTDLLPKIIIPTLVVWGDRDDYVPLKEGRVIASKIPGAELKVVKGGKHGLHVRQPETLLNIISKFIKK